MCKISAVSPDQTLYRPLSSQEKWYFVALTVSGVVGIGAVGCGLIGFFALQNSLPSWLAKLQSLSAISHPGSIAMIASGGYAVLLGIRGVLGLTSKNKQTVLFAKTNYPSGEITLEEKKQEPMKCREDLAILVFSPLLSPLSSLMSILAPPIGALVYSDLSMKEKKIKALFLNGNEKDLKEFAKNKRSSVDEKIFKLIKACRKLIRNCQSKDLPFCIKRGEGIIEGFCAMNFSKEQFVHPSSSQIQLLKSLQIAQKKLSALVEQKTLLSNRDACGIEKIKNIALMSLIKNQIRKLETQGVIRLIASWSLPIAGIPHSLSFDVCGLEILQKQVADFSFLPDDLIEPGSSMLDLHNKLVRENPYIPPYRTHPIHS